MPAISINPNRRTGGRVYGTDRIYGVTFVQSTVFIAFRAGEFAAIPSLVFRRGTGPAGSRAT